MHKLYNKKLMSSTECVDYARRKWDELTDCESVYAMFLNANLQLEFFKQMNTGDYRGTNFNLRKIVKTALELNLDHIIIFHNHTSQIALPSEIDLEITSGLIDIYEALSMQFLDHIIVTQNKHYSFLDHNLMKAG